jgi:hypothetical protein
MLAITILLVPPDRAMLHLARPSGRRMLGRSRAIPARLLRRIGWKADRLLKERSAGLLGDERARLPGGLGAREAASAISARERLHQSTPPERPSQII